MIRIGHVAQREVSRSIDESARLDVGPAWRPGHDPGPRTLDGALFAGTFLLALWLADNFAVLAPPSHSVATSTWSSPVVVHGGEAPPCTGELVDTRNVRTGVADGKREPQGEPRRPLSRLQTARP